MLLVQMDQQILMIVVNFIEMKMDHQILQIVNFQIIVALIIVINFILFLRSFFIFMVIIIKIPNFDFNFKFKLDFIKIDFT